jgi:RHS repeat-associated protein
VAYIGAGTEQADLRHLYADRLGSIILTSTRDGAVQQISAYDEYGNRDSGNAGVGAGDKGRFGYTGQIWLPELGLFHYKARMYSPSLGRFMQTDPIGYGDGMNMYAYVGNDPVNWVDPSGMLCWDEGRNAWQSIPRENCTGVWSDPYSGNSTSDLCYGPGGPGVPLVPCLGPNTGPSYQHPDAPGQQPGPNTPGDSTGGGGAGSDQQRDESKSCQRARQKSDAAFNLLPYATTGPNTWSDMGWLRAQQHVYARNRDQAGVVGDVLFFGGLGRSSAAVGGSAGVGSLSAFGGVRGGLAGIGMSVFGRISQNQAQMYDSYVRAVQDRMDYLTDCPSTGG